MRLELGIDFKQYFTPENFFFGVANAPYLCEGGYNMPDGIKNSYAHMEKQRDKYEPSGDAVRFWTNYEEQIKLAASLGLNAFRMGIEWSRIQPTKSMDPHDPPPWDYAAVDHYAKIIGIVIKHGMQPIITLHHFAHPAWLPLDMWLGDEGPDLLAAYQIKIVEEINDRLMKSVGAVMNNFLVYNEPGLVPGIYFFTDIFPIETKGPQYMIQAFDNMLSRYVRVYDGIHDLFERKGWGSAQVGVTSASVCAYELDKFILDLLRYRTFGVKRENVDLAFSEFQNDWNKRIGILAKSKLTDAQFDQYMGFIGLTGQVLKISSFTKTIDALYASPRAKKLDYISVNVYEPFGYPKGTPDLKVQPAWWEQATDGEVYYTFIKAYNEKNTDLPFYMGENTLAYRQPIGEKAEPRPDGWTRERYLKTYFMEIVKCIKEGVPIRGYLYWSLVDDFEWLDGYTPRLGLYNYDYIKHQIAKTDGLGEPAGAIYAYLIAALRSGDKVQIAKAFTNAYKK
jgi:beta-glucosidase/6-phospho-beta-glucosidase/beta-galactosidase